MDKIFIMQHFDFLTMKLSKYYMDFLSVSQ